MIIGNPLVIAFCQGTAFFVSILLIGFVYGHETVIKHFLSLDLDFNKKKPSWQQPELYARAKMKARDYFPLYWYWGNVRSAMLFWVLALVSSVDVRMPGAPEIAAAVIMLGNLGLLFTSKQQRWDRDPQQSK
ncbi:MAG: hypothetical protein ACRD3W_15555 [Terriglobales bacterium]